MNKRGYTLGEIIELVMVAIVILTLIIPLIAIIREIFIGHSDMMTENNFKRLLLELEDLDKEKSDGFISVPVSISDGYTVVFYNKKQTESGELINKYKLPKKCLDMACACLHNKAEDAVNCGAMQESDFSEPYSFHGASKEDENYISIMYVRLEKKGDKISAKT